MKVLERDDVLSSHMFRTLASEDVYIVSLVQQYCSLEQYIGTSYLQPCLRNPTDASSIVRDACSQRRSPEKRLDSYCTGIPNTQASFNCRLLGYYCGKLKQHTGQSTGFRCQGHKALTTPTFGDRTWHRCNATIPGTTQTIYFPITIQITRLLDGWKAKISKS